MPLKHDKDLISNHAHALLQLVPGATDVIVIVVSDSASDDDDAAPHVAFATSGTSFAPDQVRLVRACTVAIDCIVDPRFMCSEGKGGGN